MALIVPDVLWLPSLLAVCSLRMTSTRLPSGCGMAMVVFGVTVPPLMPTMLVPLTARLTKHGDEDEHPLAQASTPHVLPKVVLAWVPVAELDALTSIRSAVTSPPRMLVLCTTEAVTALGLGLVAPDVVLVAVAVVTMPGMLTKAMVSLFDPPVVGSSASPSCAL